MISFDRQLHKSMESSVAGYPTYSTNLYSFLVPLCKDRTPQRRSFASPEDLPRRRRVVRDVFHAQKFSRYHLHRFGRNRRYPEKSI
jgi:hypothetical protein